jgi:hypothetical protein
MELAEQKPDAARLGAAAAAALAAAIAGGIAWALIVRSTDYEVGLVAWAIGWVAGTAAVAGGRGARGMPLQIAAVVAALLGILLGKYLSYAWTLQDAAEEQGVSLGLFSDETRTFFRDDLGDVFGWFDLIFIGLAVFTAFRIPARPALPPAREPDGLIE